MCFKYIERAWRVYRKNLWTVIGANMLFIGSVLLLILASIVPLISLGAGIFSGASVLQNTAKAIGLITAAILLITIAITVAVALSTGIVGIYSGLLKNKKTYVETMIRVAKEKFWTSMGSSAIVALIIAGVSVALIVPTAIGLANFYSQGASLAAAGGFFMLFFLEIVFIALFSLLFTLRNQAIVIGNLNAVESVKASYRTVGKNYIEFLALTIVMIIASLIISPIPVFGILLSIFLIQPMIGISYTAFYMEKAAQRLGAKRTARAAGRRNRKRKKRR